MSNIANLHEHEVSFLASCILYSDIFVSHYVDVHADFFEDPSHRKIWRALVQMHDENIEFETSSISLLSQVPELDVNALASQGSFDEQIVKFSKDVLVENKRHKELQKGLQSVLSSDANSDEIIYELSKVVDELPQNVSLDGFSSEEMAKKVLETFTETKAGKRIVERYSTGLPDLDVALDGGIAPSRLYVVGARPSIGKTSLAVQLFHKVLESAGEDFTGMFVSLEMTDEALFRKQLSIVSAIPSKDIETAQVAEEDMPRLEQGFKILGDEMNFATVADPRLTSEAIVALARKWERSTQKKMLLLVVDYIQKTPLIQGKDERESVNHLMETLRRYSLTDNVAVIACSQLARDIDNRSDKRPRNLSDLKGSGNIEQDADVAMTLYRDEHYYGDDSSDIGGADIFIIKNRWGQTSDLNFTWVGELTMFADKEIKESIAGINSDEF